MTDEFVKLLDQGCVDLGVTLSDQQKEQFFKYYEMLIEKNKVMNLTAITELSDVITKHFVDSGNRSGISGNPVKDRISWP